MGTKHLSYYCDEYSKNDASSSEYSQLRKGYEDADKTVLGNNRKEVIGSANKLLKGNNSTAYADGVNALLADKFGYV